jgi:calcineurin-like phosphoesterase family protein
MNEMKDFTELNQSIWFTSDLHIGDSRLNLYGRDVVVRTTEDMDRMIIDNYNRKVREHDLVYFLGDIIYDSKYISLLKELKGTKILIKGNYDDNYTDDMLLKYFDEVHESLTIELNGISLFLNHYPTRCKSEMFNICGHIHGAWRFQRNMINVGTDAWCYYPISSEQILFYMNAIHKYYDSNVFAGELSANLSYKK